MPCFLPASGACWTWCREPVENFAIDGHETSAVVTPIGIDSDSFSRLSARAVRRAEAKRLIESLDGHALMIGVDRLDYTKGLPGRFAAYGRFLAAYPQHKHKISYLQIAAPTRPEVSHYEESARRAGS